MSIAGWARVLVYGGLLGIIVVCLLMLQSPNRASQLGWRVAGVGFGVIVLLGSHLAARLVKRG